MRPFGLALYVSLSISVVLPAAELSTKSPQPAPSDSAQNGPARDAVSQARAYLASGEYAGAEASLRLALTAAGDADSALAIRNALADLLREEGRMSEARPIYNEVLNSKDVSPRQKFDALMGLADIDGMMGNTQVSTGEWNTAIDLAHEMKNTSIEADALRGLGMTWLDAGNPSRAEPLLRRALKMAEDDATTPLSTVASTLACLGRCYRMQNKLALAENSLTRALDLERKAFGENHPQVAYVMERLADVYALRKQFDLARDYSSRALAVMRACCGENSGAVAAALVNRAGIEERANALDAAAENFAGALRIIRSNPQVARNTAFEMQVIERYSALLRAIHRDREAKELGALAKSFRAESK